MPTLRKKEYGFRLSKLRLTTLETRRKRGDLIEFYKIINGSDQVKWKNMPKRIVQGEMDGSAARNLRREGMCFSQRAREYMYAQERVLSGQGQPSLKRITTKS